MKVTRLFLASIATLSGLFTLVLPASAQVITDGTTGTLVNAIGPDFTITQGTRSGGNLFHSFTNFSIPTGGSAAFDNAIDITNIFSRVTGSTVSNIDGIIRTNGSANLFLLNPNGIFFGPNAQLNLGGSFLGTTASSIKFANGAEFSAVNLNSQPLLTVSAPMVSDHPEVIGLQFGPQAQPITNQSDGLAVGSGQTLAILGGNITLEGGSLSALGGTIALGSVAPGSNISLTPIVKGWAFDYGSAPRFQDIQLTQGVFVNASGAGAGEIQVQGRQVSLRDGSSLTANTLGNQTGKGITVRASESLSLIGTDPNQDFPSNLTTSVQRGATGHGGNLTIETPNLLLQDGAQLISRVRGAGNAGRITVHVDQLKAIGTSADLESFASGIVSRADIGSTGQGADVDIQAQHIQLLGGPEIRAITRSSGNAGNMTVRAKTIKVTSGSDTFYAGFSTSTGSDGQPATGRGGDLLVEADRIELLDGAAIRTGSGNSGNAGNLTVRAKQIEISGIDPVDQVTNSSIFTSQYGQGSGSTGKGSAGILTVETQDLTISNRGTINSSTDGEGSAGGLSIQAHQQINLRSGGQIGSNTTGKGNAGSVKIQTNTLNIQGAVFIQGRGLARSGVSALASSKASGQSGSVEVTTQRLQIGDQGILSVSDYGTGNAGNLTVNATEIRLNNSRLEALVYTGSQGNITLNSQSILLHGSNITASAMGNSDGGNITINSPIILGLKNSDIIANAVQGRGGNIQLTTQGIFGLKYRPQLTPENDITASSQFGINGSVQINHIGVNPNVGLIELLVDLVDPSQQISQGCQANSGNSFVITGQGGIPSNPSDLVSMEHPWEDLRNSPRRQTATPRIPDSPLAETTAWQRNPSTGNVELIATQSTTLLASTLNAAACVTRHNILLHDQEKRDDRGN
jgi:filamentous hemagglutinin family protein